MDIGDKSAQDDGDGRPTGDVPVRVSILGPLRVWRGGAEIGAGPRQQAFLLALLSARVHTLTSTSELIDLMWEDQVPDSAVNVIHKYIGALRRLLEPTLAPRASGSYLHRRGSSYMFTAAPNALDLVDFRRLVEAAQAAVAKHANATALDHYVTALDLWHGGAGDGFTHGASAVPIFAALDDELHAACIAAAGLAVSIGQPERVLPALQRAASTAPFHEPLQAGLITTLGASGRQAEALSVFGGVRTRLADELGIDPGEALQAAHHRVLTQGTAPSAVAGLDNQRGGSRGLPSGLVGRAEELDLLRRSVEMAFTGRPALRIVEGEPGVGKTRLVQEIATEASVRGALVVWGSCLEGDGTPSMWPWEQTLRPILDSLPAPLQEKWLASELGSLLESPNDYAAAPAIPDGGAQFRLFEQVVTVVGQVSAQRPLLLVVDDLQWADATSLQLFGHLTARLPTGTVVVGALRDRAPTPGPELSRVLAAASRLPYHRRIRLGPLGLTDVTELIRRETGHEPEAEVARGIQARTAGNPFFVQELSRLLGDGDWLGDGGASVRAGVPATVQDVVRDRMTCLDDGAHSMLRIAAVIGRDVDLDLLARAIGVDLADCLERLEPLQALGILEPKPDDPFSWRFAHDLVRESVTETIARQQAAQLHLRVADALEHIHADDESVAERLAYHLWAAGPLADPIRTAQALARAGHRAATKLAFAAAYRNLESAVQIARTAGLLELELSVLSLLNLLAVEPPGMGGSTFDLLERGAYLARKLGRETAAAEFLFYRMTGAYVSTEKDRGMWARGLHQQGQASADPVIQAYGRQAWGLHQWDLGNIDAAYQCFSRLGHTTADGVASMLANSAEPHPTPGQQNMYHLAGQVGGVPLRPRGDLGRWRIPDEWVGYLGVITALHGDVETARSLLDTVYQAEGDPFEMSGWTRYQTMAASMAGDAEWAMGATERWVAASADLPGVAQEAYVQLDWYWARALTGDDPAGSATKAEHLLAATLLDPPRWGLAYWYGLVAEMWLAAGRPDKAATALDRADQALKVLGQRYAEGLLLLLRARLLHARGEPIDVVRAAAEAARALSHQRGAHLFAHRAERFLADLDEESARR